MSAAQKQALADKYQASLDVVRSRAHQMETTGKEIGNAFPVSATFLGILALLSFIPVACFAAFVAFTTTTILVIAAVSVTSFVVGTICFALCFLVPALCVTLFIATNITAGLVALYLAHRLYVALGANPTLPAALSDLKRDVLALFRNEISHLPSTFSRRLPEVEDRYDAQGYLIQPGSLSSNTLADKEKRLAEVERTVKRETAELVEELGDLANGKIGERTGHQDAASS